MSILLAADIAEMRESYVSMDHLTDEQIQEAFEGHDSTVWKARQWGWSDTEVRDETCAVLIIEE